MKNIKLHDHEDDYSLDTSQLGFFTKTVKFHQHTVPIDEPVVNPSYYRAVVQMLLESSEDDTVYFHVNSPGGMLSGLWTLIEAIKNTDAHTVAVLTGECASAASILALHCESVIVTDSASMLAHNVSYSTGGKGSDIISHTQHIAKTSEKLIRDTYTGLLQEFEILDILNGRELYLDCDEIRERLAQRDDHLEAKFLAEQEEMKALQEQDEPKPKRKKKK